MGETSKSNMLGLDPPDSSVRSAKKTAWRRRLGGIPGIRHIYRKYFDLHEQCVFLSRIARERYWRPEPLFDDYQEDYSHNVPAEQERYQLILGATKQLIGRWGDAIEIGCSKGLFTIKLAERCSSVFASDISPRACAATAERCAAFPNVKVARLDIQRDSIIGEYDLVFVMDTLVYVHGRARVESAISRLVRAIRPGGLLVFSDVCWSGNIENAWWQRWIPEGADHHISLISKRADMRLVSRHSHKHNNDPAYSYMDHMIAIFTKL